jgi:hypothetical protein
MVDFKVRDCGTVWQIEAVSEEAKQFAQENIAVPSYLGEPHAFYADWRPARDLVEQLADQGFEIGG